MERAHFAGFARPRATRACSYGAIKERRGVRL